MEVNIAQAQKIFFSRSSFEMIYFEAFANALDANATTVDIDIHLKDKDAIQNLALVIKDNGEGFTDARFAKFGKLFDVDEPTHKGLGRLVYLCYFENIHVESIFSPEHKRIFDFNENFISTDCQIESIQNGSLGTVLKMTRFSGDRLAKNEFIRPLYIKNALLERFYMKFYKAKLAGQRIVVNISYNAGGGIIKEKIDTEDIPNFEVKTIDSQLDIFNRIELYYQIKDVDTANSKIITAIAVDDRSHVVDIITDDNLHYGKEMIFLLISESFRGNIDESRQNLKISDVDLNQIKDIFRKAISEIINEKYPAIKASNERKIEHLTNTYPHLSGYIENDTIGYVSSNEILKKAQDKFFRDQKEILTAENLTDEQFEKSLELSARSLAEYILFRQNVIKKMLSFDTSTKEADLHNLLAPKHSEFISDNIVQDIYRNNVWVLDDKFMSYCTVLSEAEMSKVIDVLTQGEKKDNDDDRPDITLFFSGNPLDEMVDVVVVELKRIGLSAENNSIVEFQLDTRTQRLAEFYGNRIQRMWFYGIVDIDDRYKLHLINNGYKPLFSHGSVFYRSKEVYSDLSQTTSVIQNSYIMDFTALVKDAESRNSTFLKIIRSKFENNSL